MASDRAWVSSVLKNTEPAPAGRDAMNLALIAGGDEQVAFAIERHGPDVFLVRIVEQLRLAVGADFVNLAVGIGGGVDLVLESSTMAWISRPSSSAKGRLLPARSITKTLAVPLPGAAAGGVKIAFGVGRQGPEIGRGGIEDLGELGRKKDAAVGAQGEILERSAFEIGAVAMLPEVGVHCKAGGAGRRAPPGGVELFSLDGVTLR